MRGMRNVLVIALGLGVLTAPDVLTHTSSPFAPAGAREDQQSSQSQPQATFRTTTSLVEVDVVIHDKKGDFVSGLKAEDLQLLEDGKPQKIEQFYLVSHERGGQLIPVTGDREVAPEDRARRIFVVMFDEGHLAHESLMRTKQGAIQFIKENIGPGDFGGIFENGRMYNGRLTTSSAELLAGLNRVNVGFENRQSLLATFREFPRIPSEIDAVRIAEGSIEVARRIGVKVCQDDPQSCALNGGLNQVENLIQQKSRLYVRQARMLTYSTLQNLRYVVSRLSRIPGRKTLVLLTEGFFVEESRDDLLAIGAEAARGGTTIYSIDGRGLIGAPSATSDVLSEAAGRSTAFDSGEVAPFLLTNATGGMRLANIDDVGRAFNMVVRDTSTYYVIGYRPENSVMDGKFRKIEVKTSVSGVNIRSRKGYAAVALPPMQTVRAGWSK
jgi:VWFA-related protein